VATRVRNEIRVAQETTLTDLRVDYEEGRATLVAMAEHGASKPQLVRVAKQIITSMRGRADRGLQRVDDLRAGGIATLERIGADVRLMALVEEAAATAARRVDGGMSDFAHGLRNLVERLVL
jgi:hypothetical protein